MRKYKTNQGGINCMLEIDVAKTVVEELNKQSIPLELTVQKARTMDKLPSDGHDVYGTIQGNIYILAWIKNGICKNVRFGDITL